MKPHIVFLAAWYPDNHDPMFGLFVQKHAALLTSEYRVSVLHITNHQDKDNGYFTHITNNISVTNLNIRTKNRIFRWIYFFVAGLKAYRYICSQHGKPIVNHIHILTRMGVLAVWIKFRMGIPYIITEHWSRYFPIPGTYKNILRKCLTRYICNHASEISTVSLQLEKAMKIHGLGREKSWLRINNVVDDKVFNLPVTFPPAEPIRFINVSCFEDKSKNISGLVNVVASLVKDGLRLECLLAGTGDDWLKIKQLILLKGLDKQIIMLGLLNETQVAEQMKRCHFYIQSSHYENVPVVISEALMCGLPVVATNVGGLSEMVNQTNGYLADSDKQDELLFAVKMMIENYKTFDRVAIRAAAIQKYSPDSVRSQLIQLYDGVTQ